jgi:hypothetical protein
MRQLLIYSQFLNGKLIMDNFVLYCVSTAIFTGLGVMLSKIPIMGQQGIASTVFSALLTTALGVILEFVALAFKGECKVNGQMVDYDTEACLNAGGNINIVADTLTSTILGFNPIASAIVCFLLIKFGCYLYKSISFK